MADTAVIKVTADTSQAERALGSLNNTLKGLLTVSAITAFSQFADSLTNLSNKLGIVTQDGQTTNQLFQVMAKSALALGAPLQDVGDLFFRIANNTKDLSLSQQQQVQVTENLIKGFQLTGQSMGEMRGGIIQLGQALSQGTLRGDELNSVLEQLPMVADAVAAKFGVQRGALKALGEQGKITSKDLVDAILSSGQAIDSAWGTRVPTIGQSFERLKTVVGLVTEKFDEQNNISRILSYALLIVAEAVIDVSEWMQKWGKVILYVGEALILIYAPIRVATALLLNAGKVVEFVIGPFIALGEAIAGTGAIANTIAGTAFGGMIASIAKVFSGLNGLFSEDKTSMADKYNKKLEEINKRLGLDQVEASNKAKAASAALTAQQIKDAEAIRKATQARNEDLRKIVQGQQDQIALTKYNGDLEGIESTILSTNRSLIKEILNDKNQIIGYTKGLNTEEERNMRIALQRLEIAKQQQALRALTLPESTSQVTSRATGIFQQTNPGLEIEAQRQQAALDLLKTNGLIKEQEYANQEILINKAKTDAILANEQKSAEARMQVAGVTNQSIIDAVKQQMANVAMIQQGGVAGAQGVLGAMDNVFASMSAHNKQAFEAHKALATAQALISTYQAAAQALSMPPGPPISLIYVAGAVAAGMAQVAAIQSQQYSGKAIGGSVMGNTPYIVGEKGPELFTPASSGMITPNDKMGGGQTANINFTIVANDAVGFDALLNTRKGMIKQLVSDAMLDKGQRF